MTEKIRRVDRDGPPNPKKHPWVMKRPGQWAPWILTHNFPTETWNHGWEWFPTDPPPTEYVEDEGVEVDGRRWRLADARPGMRHLHMQRPDGTWEERPLVSRHGNVAIPEDTLRRFARVAAAFGLVDQPTVPKALVDWLEQRANESGGSPAGSVYDDGYQHTAIEALDAIRAGEFGPVEPKIQWVTDRNPYRSVYPTLWVNDEGSYRVYDRDIDRPASVSVSDRSSRRWRWVSLSSLLGDR